MYYGDFAYEDLDISINMDYKDLFSTHIGILSHFGYEDFDSTHQSILREGDQASVTFTRKSHLAFQLFSATGSIKDFKIQPCVFSF